jgi:hypothetical protein
LGLLVRRFFIGVVFWNVSCNPTRKSVFQVLGQKSSADYPLNPWQIHAIFAAVCGK